MLIECDFQKLKIDCLTNSKTPFTFEFLDCREANFFFSISASPVELVAVEHLQICLVCHMIQQMKLENILTGVCSPVIDSSLGSIK